MLKTHRVAIMLDIETAYSRHTNIYAGTQTYAEEQGWEVTIDQYTDDTLPERKSKSVPYDGVIARATKKLAVRSAKHNIPVVNVWRNSPVRDLVPSVYPDFAAMGRIRAEHLLSRGFRRFAALTSKTVGQEIETEAFCETVEMAGYSCSLAKVPLTPSKTLAQWRKTEQVIDNWMSKWKPPVGVYVGSDDVGRLVVQACRSRGLLVPVDVAVIAGFNEKAICEQPRPSITSIEPGSERVGYEAARLLHQLMDGKPAPKEPILLPPQGLVVRESTDFFAVDDELVAAALKFIASNSHKHIGPNEVSKAINTETRTLQSRFTKCLNRPIAKEIRRVRIERAKRELTQSKRSLADIARDVGFGEAMRMYEVFRRELGVTPSEYRQQRNARANH